jgi:hypothetical protein
MNVRYAYTKGKEYRVLIPSSAGIANIPVNPCYALGETMHDTYLLENNTRLYYFDAQSMGDESPVNIFALESLNETSLDKIRLVYIPDICLPYISSVRTKKKPARVLGHSRPRSKKAMLVHKTPPAATAGNIANLPSTSATGLVPFRKGISKRR